MLKQTKRLCDNLSITTLNANGLVLTELNYSGIDVIPPSRSKNAILQLVIKGNYVCFGKKNEYHRSSGHLLYIQEEEILEAKFNSPSATTFAVEIIPSWLARFDVALPQLSTHSLPNNSFANNICHMLWQEYVIDDEFSRMAVQGIFLQLMAVLMRERKNEGIGSPKWVAKLKEIIREQYAGNFSLDALGRTLDIHPVYLSREFPKYFQCSLSEYIRRVKIKKAIALMSDETLSLTAIAHKCGFSDQSHFTRVFKKMHNLTPSEYRQTIVDN